MHSGNAVTLHGSGPTCDLPFDHSEVAGGSKVDLLSASGGTFSTLEELSLLGPSPVFSRSDPMKVKQSSRLITKKSHHIRSDFISVTTDFLGGLTGQVGGGSAAAGLSLPGVVAPVNIHELKKKSNNEIKVKVKKMLKQILLVQTYCLPLLLAISLILLI